MTFDDETVRCPIATLAATSPREVLVIQDGREVTHAEFDKMVRSFVGGLRQLGVEPADRVAFQLPNRIESLALFWACFRTGAIACPISTRVPTASVPGIADSVSAKDIVVQEDLESWRNLADATEQVHPRSAATIIFSSGSTGTPKAIVHGLDSHFASAIGSNENIHVRRGDRWLLSLPVYHVGGLAIMFRCVLAGASVVIDSRSSDIAEQIRSNGVTHVSLVATQLKRIMTKDRSVLASLGALLLGGSALPRTLVQKSIEAGVPLRTTYGLSEMASQVTTTPNDTVGEHLYSSGRPVGEAEVKVAPDGEILVRGPALMKGYLRNGEIDPSVDRDGWFHTKDRGALNTNGYLRVLGRIDNMFISGGENIYPEEIESALLEISGIDQAIVVEIPSSEFGQRPVAFLDCGKIEAERIVMSLTSRLAKFKIPDRFLPWPANEIGTGIKPSRRRLADLAKDLLDF